MGQIKTLAEDRGKKYEGPEACLLSKVAVWKGRAHTLEVDCLVVSNDQDPSFQGTRLLKDIHRVAGPRLLEECKKKGRRREGEVWVSGAYNLPVCALFHAVTTPGGEFRDRHWLLHPEPAIVRSTRPEDNCLQYSRGTSSI